ncbi:MAG: DMT family transporter [Flavobacterium sp.]
MQGDNLKSYLHLHFIVFVWGFTAVLGALITLDAFPLVWFRMCIATALIFTYIKIKKIPLAVPKKMLWVFLFSGLVIALHWFTFFEAIKVSNVSLTLACLSTGAFFASLLESILYGKRVVWYELMMGFIVVIALCIIIYGAYFLELLAQLISNPLNFFEIIYTMAPGEAVPYWGIALALTSAFLSATFAIMNGNFAKRYNPATISFYELLGGVGCFSLYLLLSGSFTAEFFILSPNDWLWLFVLGSFCTAYAFIASVQVMKFLSPYTVMLTINMEPVYGIILAVLVFKDKEKMGMPFYIGAAIILITVIVNGILKNYTSKESN